MQKFDKRLSVDKLISKLSICSQAKLDMRKSSSEKNPDIQIFKENILAMIPVKKSNQIAKYDGLVDPLVRFEILTPKLSPRLFEIGKKNPSQRQKLPSIATIAAFLT
jgi:hypothetical protein